MNATEKRYAVQRIDETATKAELALQEKARVKQLSNQERIDLIFTGRVKLVKKPKKPSLWGTVSVSDVFDFSPYKRKPKMTEEAYTKALATVREEAQKVTDSVMLGDSKEAMRALESFAAFCKKFS
jgi:hypothetical protein